MTGENIETEFSADLRGASSILKNRLFFSFSIPIL